MIDLTSWIRENTKDIKTVIEMGAGYFDKLSYVSNDVVNKVGIELYEEYINNAKFNECIKVKGDFRKWREYNLLGNPTCAMFIDTIEHIRKVEAIDLIRDMQKDLSRIIIFTPRGEHIQDGNIWNDGNELQSHKSYWFEIEFTELGFRTETEPDFHKGGYGKNDLIDFGAIFAIWEK